MDDLMQGIDPVNNSILKITKRMHEIAELIHHEYSTEIDIDINSQAKY